MSQWDVGEMEATLWAWCPEEQRERMRFAVNECSAVDWGGVRSRIPCTGRTLSALAPSLGVDLPLACLLGHRRTLCHRKGRCALVSTLRSLHACLAKPFLIFDGHRCCVVVLLLSMGKFRA